MRGNRGPAIGAQRAQPVAGKIGSTDRSPDHVRRRRHAALAGFARRPPEAIPAAVWAAFDVSGDHPPGRRSGAVRSADRCDQSPVSLSGRRAARGDRRRGRYSARTDRGAIPDRRSLPAPPLRSSAAAIPSLSRSPPTTSSPIRRLSPKSAAQPARRRSSDRIVTFGVRPDAPGDRIRLHPPGTRRFGPGFSRSKNSSKSRTRKPQRAMWPRIFLELRQLHVSRRASCSTNFAASSRTAPRLSRRRSKRRRRPRLCYARCESVRAARRRNRSIMR